MRKTYKASLLALLQDSFWYLLGVGFVLILLSWMRVSETTMLIVASIGCLWIITMLILDLQTKVTLTDQNLIIHKGKKKLSYPLETAQFGFHMKDGSHTARSYHLIIKPQEKEEERVNLAALGESQFYQLLEALHLLGDQSSAQPLKTQKKQ
ncbi:MAG: hypothetical protein Q4B28_03390 [bacterium]|nr:hypothetical protein [bacterium]